MTRLYEAFERGGSIEETFGHRAEISLSSDLRVPDD
jgi:hypothetical protein